LFSLAAVSFLNAIPLVEWFVANESQSRLLLDLPSRLPVFLREGKADVALMPVVEVFREKNSAFISSAGIACQGPVDSVKLFTNGPVEEVQQIMVDRGSRTSVALLRILMREFFKIEPSFVEGKPQLGVLPRPGEGTLVIGDRCFEYEFGGAGEVRSQLRAFDLGEMWFELTSLPFVFATWSVGPGFLDKWGPGGAESLASLLNTSRDYGLAHLDFLATREAGHGRLGYLGKSTPDAVAHYFRESLVYELGDQEYAGMHRFHELCVKYGLVPDYSMPPVL